MGLRQDLVLHCCEMDWSAAQDVLCKQEFWPSQLQDDIHGWQVAPHDRMMQCCPAFPILRGQFRTLYQETPVRC